jgi:branched-chain amino acid transport system ATP-binding protein
LSALQVEALTAGYSAVPIVSDVHLRAVSERILAVVGPNGAGKSTMLKAVCGLLRNVSGRVMVDGRDVRGWRPHLIARHGIAYVPQVSNIFPSLTVTENLEIGGYVARREIRERMQRVFEVFPDLQRAARQKAGNLSGGQRNMLAMARALMLSPKVVLLDEPTAGLAPIYVGTVWKLVQRVAESGAAVVVVEQNVDLALRHAHTVSVLVNGRNRLEGTPEEVRQHDLSAIFLGGGAAPASPPTPSPRRMAGTG